MFDSHCHLDFLTLQRRNSFLKAAAGVGVQSLMVPATDLASWAKLEALPADAKVPCRIFKAFGLHPWWVSEADEESLQTLNVSKWPISHAIGECGLDASPTRIKRVPLGLQERALSRQIAVARELERPLIVHQVGAAGRCLELLRKDLRGVIHGFQGTAGLGREYTRRGFFLGLGRQLLDPRRRQLRNAAKELPLENFLLETDEPDWESIPFGSGLLRVAEELALLRSEKVELICEITQINAEKCFDLAA